MRVPPVCASPGIVGGVPWTPPPIVAISPMTDSPWPLVPANPSPPTMRPSPADPLAPTNGPSSELWLPIRSQGRISLVVGPRRRQVEISLIVSRLFMRCPYLALQFQILLKCECSAYDERKERDREPDDSTTKHEYHEGPEESNHAGKEEPRRAIA